MIALAGELTVCFGLTVEEARRAAQRRAVRLRRRDPRPPRQGASAARRALRLHARRPLRGVRHAGRPAGDARLLRQALPRGGPRAGARRRRGRSARWPRGRSTAATRAARVAADRQTRHFDAVDVVPRGREPGHVGRVEPDRAVGRPAFLGVGEGRRPRRRRAARAPAPRAGLAVAEVDPPADRAAMLLDVDHLADRRPHAYVRARHARLDA